MILNKGCKNNEQNSLDILDIGDFKVQTLELEFASAINPASSNFSNKLDYETIEGKRAIYHRFLS